MFRASVIISIRRLGHESQILIAPSHENCTTIQWPGTWKSVMMCRMVGDCMTLWMSLLRELKLRIDCTVATGSNVRSSWTHQFRNLVPMSKSMRLSSTYAPGCRPEIAEW
jgi:hypothetical protein